MKKNKNNYRRSLCALLKVSLLTIQKSINYSRQIICCLFCRNLFKLKNLLHKEYSCGKSKHGSKITDILIGLLTSCEVRLLVLVLLLAFPSLIIKTYAMDKQSIQAEIAGEIIRFHVIANSDSAEDQALKLAVKNALVEGLAPYLNQVSSIEAARELLLNKIPFIKELAQDTVSLQGYSYPVEASLEECYFPLKLYGEYAFPPGYYEALKVEIGDAKGKNWWCVMFPPLCFVDETYSIVDESSGKKLQHLLTEDEYEALKIKKTPVKIKFKLFELIKKLLDR